MIYPIDEIIRNVRVVTDNNSSDEPLINSGDIDTLDLNKIIESHIETAVRQIETVAPTFMLDSGYHFGEELYWNEDASGKIILPDDFMRLIVFKMSDWTRSIYSAISEDTDQYILQSSKYGIRGNYQKPVCAIIKSPEGLVLEFYSSKSQDAVVEKAMYLPMPKINDGAIEICERCFQSVIYQIGALTKNTLGEDSTILTTLAKELLI